MPKTMKQPRKDVLREQLALAAEEIIRERQMHAITRQQLTDFLTNQRPVWWRRLLAWVEDKGRLLCP